MDKVRVRGVRVRAKVNFPRPKEMTEAETWPRLRHDPRPPRFTTKIKPRQRKTQGRAGSSAVDI